VQLNEEVCKPESQFLRAFTPLKAKNNAFDSSILGLFGFVPGGFCLHICINKNKKRLKNRNHEKLSNSPQQL